MGEEFDRYLDEVESGRDLLGEMAPEIKVYGIS